MYFAYHVCKQGKINSTLEKQAKELMVYTALLSAISNKDNNKAIQVIDNISRLLKYYSTRVDFSDPLLISEIRKISNDFKIDTDEIKRDIELCPKAFALKSLAEYQRLQHRDKDDQLKMIKRISIE